MEGIVSPLRRRPTPLPHPIEGLKKYRGILDVLHVLHPLRHSTSTIRHWLAETSRRGD
jgi:hypothetical protein